MVSPDHFCSNAQTRQDNVFMGDAALDAAAVKASHAAWVALLRGRGIDVSLWSDQANTPDAVFCNNWFLCHHGLLVLFPMKAESRRAERRAVVVASLGAAQTLDLTHWEEKAEFLEGTGSLVVDWTCGVAYMCVSQRSSLLVAKDFCARFAEKTGRDLQLVAFEAVHNGASVYHTNGKKKRKEKIESNLTIFCLHSDNVCWGQVYFGLLGSSVKWSGRIVVVVSALGKANCGNFARANGLFLRQRFAGR